MNHNDTVEQQQQQLEQQQLEQQQLEQQQLEQQQLEQQQLKQRQLSEHLDQQHSVESISLVGQKNVSPIPVQTQGNSELTELKPVQSIIPISSQAQTYLPPFGQFTSKLHVNLTWLCTKSH